MISLPTQFSGNLQLDTSYRNGAYGDKGNIISSKRERIFLRDSFVIYEFISQSYSLDLKQQFPNTLFVESAR